MSSTNKTAYLQMHSWVRTDPVLCDDFNENFNKIDSAIGNMNATFGRCEIYSGAYVGTGESVHSLTFPKAPSLLAIQIPGSRDIYTAIIVEGAYLSSPGTSEVVSINGTTITLTAKVASSKANNVSGEIYNYVAFAPASV